MQRELQTVDALAGLDLPASTIRSPISLPAPTASIRIDAAHPAVLMLNDITKGASISNGPSRCGSSCVPTCSARSLLPSECIHSGVRRRPGHGAGLQVLGYMMGILQQGAPVRFAVVLTRRLSKSLRHVALRRTLTGATRGCWHFPQRTKTQQAEASVQALEAKAATAEAEGGAGERHCRREGLSEEDAEAERLGVLLSKLFIFCKRKAGTNAAILPRVQLRCARAQPPPACRTPVPPFPLPTIYERVPVRYVRWEASSAPRSSRSPRRTSGTPSSRCAPPPHGIQPMRSTKCDPSSIFSAVPRPWCASRMLPSPAFILAGARALPQGHQGTPDL